MSTTHKVEVSVSGEPGEGFPYRAAARCNTAHWADGEFAYGSSPEHAATVLRDHIGLEAAKRQSAVTFVYPREN